MEFRFGKTNLKCLEFSTELDEKGYAIFSKRKAKIPGYYPTRYPEFDEIQIDEVEPDDIITIRAFFVIGKDKHERIDGGLIDVKVEQVRGDEIWANLLTELPPSFPLQTNMTVVLSIDELLYFSQGY